MKKTALHHVIIGNSAAGISAAREIRKCDPAGRITIFSKEPTFGYSRVLLPLYLAGKISRRQMIIAPRGFYSDWRIRLLRGEPVEAIEPKERHLRTPSGKVFTYDHLLLAAGSSPAMLNVPGADLEGVHYLRTLSDAEGIRGGLSSPGPVVVVGGGLVGVKSVEALLARRKKITWVISSPGIFSLVLDRTASDMFLRAFEKKGVQIRLRTDVVAFEGEERLERVRLSDGTSLPCSLAVIGKGIQPNIDFLQGAGLALNRGVLVDEHMATNLPGIFAAGDLAEPFDLVQETTGGNGLWPWAAEGGRIAGSNMAGVPASLPGTFRMNSAEVLGIRVVSAGRQEGGEEQKVFRREGAVYRKLVFSGGTLKGFILAGDIRCAGVLTSLLRTQTGISRSELEKEAGRGFFYGPKLAALGGRVAAIDYKEVS